MPTQNNSIALAWAKELGGAAALLEHRYFGTSKPFGATDPTKQLDDFKYLTLDNVMDDAVVFVDSLRANLTGGNESKAIITGCSYPGWLVTIYRQNRPETFWGAVASGAPVEAWSTDKDTSRKADYSTWVNNIDQQESYVAWEKIGAAYTALQDTIQAGNFSQVQEAFNTCDLPTNDTAPVLNLYGGAIHGLVAQYNTHFLRVNPFPDPLQSVINITLSEPDSLQILNRTIWSWFEHVNLPCLNLSNPAADIAAAVPAIEGPVWDYITCTYMTQVGNSVYAPDTMFAFGPLDSSSIKADLCATTLNTTAIPADELRQRYKFTHADLQNSTRLLWVGGEYDGTSGFMAREPGVNLPRLSPDVNVARFLSVPTGAHCEESQAEKDDDKEEVKRARRKIVQTIRGWLA